MDVSYLIFKIVDSRDAVAKATWTYPRRILKGRMGNNLFVLIAILIYLIIFTAYSTAPDKAAS